MLCVLMLLLGVAWGAEATVKIGPEEGAVELTLQPVVDQRVVAEQKVGRIWYEAAIATSSREDGSVQYDVVVESRRGKKRSHLARATLLAPAGEGATFSTTGGAEPLTVEIRP